MDESVCLCDFAGNYKDCGFWYDYFPKYKAVKFGGLLSDIPNMPVDYEPAEKECEIWIKDHNEFDYRPLDKLTVEIILEDCYPLNGVGESNKLEFQKKVTEQLQKALKEKLNETTKKIQG